MAGYLPLQLHALEILLESEGSLVHGEPPEVAFYPNASRLLHELFHLHCWHAGLENNNNSRRVSLLPNTSLGEQRHFKARFFS